MYFRYAVLNLYLCNRSYTPSLFLIVIFCTLLLKGIITKKEDNGKGRRVFEANAESAESREEWIEALNAAFKADKKPPDLQKDCQCILM